ncbi:MAG TPA: hypothetical protein VK973_09175 [Arenicellales bacterium]|nr:hypothetical protein [Arenicellales bacterium]
MSIRSKAIGVVLVVVAGIAVAGYAAAPWLLEKIALRAAEGLVEVQELEVESVSLSRVEVASVRAGTAQLQMEAGGASIRFEPWPFRVLGIDINRARVAVSEPPTGSGQTTFPAPPDFPLRIDELALAWQTPWGELTTTASVSTAPGDAGGLTAQIRGRDFSALLTNPEPGRHDLELFDSGANRILALNARNDGQQPFELDARLAAEGLSAWLRDTELLPRELQTPVEPYAISGGEVAVQGELGWNLDFSVDIRGRIEVRDRREPGAQLFE